jgi:hypothetical protein
MKPIHKRRGQLIEKGQGTISRFCMVSGRIEPVEQFFNLIGEFGSPCHETRHTVHCTANLGFQTFQQFVASRQAAKMLFPDFFQFFLNSFLRLRRNVFILCVARENALCVGRCRQGARRS